MKKIIYLFLLLIVGICIYNCKKEISPEEIDPQNLDFNISIPRDTTIILQINDSFHLSIFPANAKVTLSISVADSYKYPKNGVITINEEGEIKAVGAGMAYVIIENNTRRISFPVVVVELPSKLYISESLIVLKTKRSLQLFNQYLDQYQLTLFGGIRWKADDSSIVHVSSSGYLTALKEGSTKLKVSMINYPEIYSEYMIQVLDHIVYLAGESINENGYASVYWRNNILVKSYSNEFYFYRILYLNGTIYLTGISYSGFRAFIINNDTRLLYPEAESFVTGIINIDNDIYTCGYYTLNGIRKLALWKNRILTPVLSESENTMESMGTCIMASATREIFVGGYIKNDQGIQVACYWKNNLRTDLSDGKTNSVVNSIYVDGSDVYAAGQIINKACYWKNGIKYDLESNYSDAESIFIYNTDVYIAGSFMSNSNSMACYWKNGIRHDLSLGTGAISGYANSIKVIEGKEYISGYYSLSNTYNKSIGCYWKNGIRYDIPTSVHPGVKYLYSIVYCMAIE